jgi:FAD/FMN-containing dehydrogenase
MMVQSSPSSRFSTVAGWVATGGIGIGSVSGGHLSRWVSELEVVTSDGQVRTLRPSDKRFKSLFGSEGRLAVIVSVTLQARPKPKEPFPTLLFFDDRAKALLKIDREDSTGFVRCLDHLVGRSHVNRHRFFHEHMAAGAQAVNRHAGMQRVRRDDDGDIRFDLGEHLAIVLVKGAADLGGLLLACFDVDVTARHHVNLFRNLRAAVRVALYRGRHTNYGIPQ